jgi:hypothetical protein
MAETAGVRLKLDSVIDLPFEQKKLDFKMSLSRERLNNINKFWKSICRPMGLTSWVGDFSCMIIKKCKRFEVLNLCRAGRAVQFESPESDIGQG